MDPLNIVICQPMPLWGLMVEGTGTGAFLPGSWRPLPTGPAESVGQEPIHSGICSPECLVRCLPVDNLLALFRVDFHPVGHSKPLVGLWGGVGLLLGLHSALGRGCCLEMQLLYSGIFLPFISQILLNLIFYIKFSLLSVWFLSPYWS